MRRIAVAVAVMALLAPLASAQTVDEVVAKHIKAKGGYILTEAESSCVVYGMPRAVVEACVSDRSVPLDEMASTIMERI